MFKRRKPLTGLETVKQVFWPDMGWKRSIIYVKHRILRVADTPHNIALGLALGLGVSFTPLLGTHFIQAGFLAFLLRGNVFSAIIGTFIGNPWTFPFFWWAGFSFGRFLFSFFGIHGAGSLPEHLDFAIMTDIAMHHPLSLFLPWMLGGYILLLLSVAPAYFVYYNLVKSAKKARAKAMALRKEKRKNKQEEMAA